MGVDAFLLRWTFALLGMAGGVGVLLYLIAWAAMPASSSDVAAHRREPTDQRRIAFAMVVAGSLLLLREAGLWPGDVVMLPLTLGALGSGVIWASADAAERTRWTRGIAERARWTTGSGIARTAVGVLLVVLGMALFLAANGLFAALRVAGLATAVTLLGAVLVLGPLLARLTQGLREERVARIRSQERAEVAAHLHDSVLHTLALMQRANDGAEMVALARHQERELRAWLHGRRDEGPERLRSAMDELAGRVERLHGVPVDIVVVGEAELDERSRALVAACQEAAVNAARHSGAPRVAVYAEVEAEGLRAWVRDEGKGFDATAVPPDRRGIADSIVGRLRRHGGSATVSSEPGEGTEWQLWLPMRPAP
jgi:signal transduction histidine kinase